jgi:hypothetical protein
MLQLRNLWPTSFLLSALLQALQSGYQAIAQIAEAHLCVFILFAQAALNHAVDICMLQVGRSINLKFCVEHVTRRDTTRIGYQLIARIYDATIQSLGCHHGPTIHW